MQPQQAGGSTGMGIQFRSEGWNDTLTEDTERRVQAWQALL